MDGTFHYRGYHGCRSFCRLRVYEPDGERGLPLVALFTEREDNPGTSITNRIEHLATEVYKLLERPEAGLTVIEHYEERGFVGKRPMFKEEFDRVTLMWTTYQGFIDPRWKPICRVDVERIIGRTLETVDSSDPSDHKKKQ
jgi:hypothetical protein